MPEIAPTVQLGGLKSQLRESEDNLRPVFGGVVDHLGEDRGFGHLNWPQCFIVVPLHLDPFLAVDFGRPLNKPFAGVTEVKFAASAKVRGGAPSGWR